MNFCITACNKMKNVVNCSRNTKYRRQTSLYAFANKKKYGKLKLTSNLSKLAFVSSLLHLV